MDGIGPDCDVATSLVAGPAARFRYKAPYVVIEGSEIVQCTTTEERAIQEATRALRRMIERHDGGCVKVLDGSGHVLWREFAGF